RLQFLIEHTPAAVAMFDRDMRYIRHSRKWLADYGLDNAALIGRSHYDVFPDIPERWKQIHRDGVAGHIQSCQEDCFVRDDGSEVWLEWAIHPWTDDDGEIGGIVMFTNVITQRKQTEWALEQARRQAEAANLAKSEFLANMSHEIRTPLTAILGFTELVKDRQRDADAVELCTTIERNGEHLLELINDILDLSKVEAGRVELNLEACSPAAIVRDIGQTLRVRADQKCLELAVEVDDDVPARCRIDVRRLRQMLINLVGNAIKFTTQGRVTVQLRQVVDDAGRWLEFAVTDTGIGIPADKLSLLFEPFSQIDSSTTRTQGGTGLGLCISRRLARMCGGDIAVLSSADKGSTFTIRLPIVPVTEEREPPVVASLPDASATQTPESPVEAARILIAEDSSDNRRLLDFVLRKAGLMPTFVENGQQLLERLSTAAAGDDFDLVLVDMQMPVMDGYTAVRALRERGCRLPLIALTANAMDGDRWKCLEAGCNDYLTKPIDRAALLAAAAAVRSPRGTVVEIR
ncbi:MAG TPA: ATP-binding protein, partial [Planctomycetaceae bacterium]|nr:ATP-binding protein [Planctomycetaceae bacterium]